MKVISTYIFRCASPRHSPVGLMLETGLQLLLAVDGDVRCGVGKRRSAEVSSGPWMLLNFL